jgi:hypothetical protein
MVRALWILMMVVWLGGLGYGLFWVWSLWRARPPWPKS